MNTGARIGELAREKGINLHQLAVKAGVSYNTIYAIVKRGSQRINIENLKKIANVLGVHWSELYSDDIQEQFSIIVNETMKEGHAAGVFKKPDEFIEMFKSDEMQKLGKKGVEIQQRREKENKEKEGLPFFELDKVCFDASVKFYIANLLLAHEIYPKDRKALMELGFTAGDAFSMMDISGDESPDFVDEVADRLDEMQDKREKTKED